MTTTADSRPADLPHFSLVIDGQPAEAVSGRSYQSIDPFRGAPWATAADGDGADVDLAVPGWTGTVRCRRGPAR